MYLSRNNASSKLATTDGPPAFHPQTTHALERRQVVQVVGIIPAETESAPHRIPTTDAATAATSTQQRVATQTGAVVVTIVRKVVRVPRGGRRKRGCGSNRKVAIRRCPRVCASASNESIGLLKRYHRGIRLGIQRKQRRKSTVAPVQKIKSTTQNYITHLPFPLVATPPPPFFYERAHKAART